MPAMQLVEWSHAPSREINGWKCKLTWRKRSPLAKKLQRILSLKMKLGILSQLKWRKLRTRMRRILIIFQAVVAGLEQSQVIHDLPSLELSRNWA
ncbi:hypothetical protein ACFX2K_025786 [Malus domestica]